jgi:signal transduction histidine kinase
MIGMRRKAGITVQASRSAALDGRLPRMRWTAGGLGILDIAAAALLSCIELAVGFGWLPTSGKHLSVAAAVGVLAMTVPVAGRRPAPVAAAGTMAAAALLNGLVFGSLVRCGVALPAFFLVVFAVGVRRDRGWSALGLALCGGGVVAEGMYDPQIQASGLAFVLPVLAGFYAAGCLVRARTEMASALRHKSAELRRQREQTARLAVHADRAEISADLEQSLHAQIGGIATAAAAGLEVLDTDHAAARQAMAAIEHNGRYALEHMRQMLGSLREAAPSQPQPTLARLPELLAGATTASATLTVEGNPRTLPAGLELSGYRIVEHLLEALEDAPEAAVEVLLRFCPDAVELYVSGPSSAGADLRAVLAAAAERASLHSGTIQHRLDGRICHASARLPLVSGHA